MVLAGEFLERPVLIPREDGLTLEGLFHRGERAPAVVVCAPHPRLGGSMDSPVVAELAWALTRAGHATFCFNYQGVGASQGERQAPPPTGERLAITSLASEIGDARAALEQLQSSTSHRRVVLCGYSFGAAVALGLARELRESTPLLLIAPPTSLFDFSLLSTIDRPTWIAFGDRDALVDRAELVELAKSRPQLTLDLLTGSDHVFTRGLTELGARAVAWLDGLR